jgi:hypothetical protein
MRENIEGLIILWFGTFVNGSLSAILLGRCLWYALGRCILDCSFKLSTYKKWLKVESFSTRPILIEILSFLLYIEKGVIDYSQCMW